MNQLKLLLRAQLFSWAFLLLGDAVALAGSATWNLNPTSGDWNTAANWTPMTVPNRPADAATFQVSNNTNVSLSAMATVNRIVFGPGASPFTITANPGNTLTVSGQGIVNSSGITQNFSALSDQDANFGLFTFSANASAGEGNVFTNHGSDKVSFGGGGVLFTDGAMAGTCLYFNLADGAGPGGGTTFLDSSSADHGMFVNAPGNASGIFGGVTSFIDTATAGSGTFVMQGPSIANTQAGRVTFAFSSTAGSGMFVCEGSAASDLSGGFVQFSDGTTAGTATFTGNGGTVSGAFGGHVGFGGTANAGDAIITVNGGTVAGASGASVSFSQGILGDHPSAGNATLIANGGVSGATGGEISFGGGNGLLPDGGTARVELFGNGHLDISLRSQGQALTIGSVEGDGIIFLGKVQLGVGTRNLDTLFSGLIQDGGVGGGVGGSLSKAGTGRLTLTGANSYTGGTTVSAGTLIVQNRTGSATGTGAVQVKVGTLGGGGTIAGAVKVGTDGISVLAPAAGRSKPTALTIQSSLILESTSTYNCTFRVKGNKSQNDLVIANGVTINGAAIAISSTTQGQLADGTVLTVISNTSANPIVGTFTNLADGQIITVNGNNLQADYEGGDGNDLTLTVVP